MSSPNYYGGYSLVRSSAQTAGSVSGAHAAKDTARPSGLSRINFASCNSDWMPSLATSSAAGVRSALAPAEAAAPLASTTTTTTTTTTNNNNTTSSTRPTFLHAFLTMQNFYRGAPLRTTSSIAKMASTSATVASTTTAAEVKKVIVPAATGAATRTEAKKVLPVMPLPIGSDTWSAFSDPAFAAKSGVVATRHVLTRPVAPMAIGVTDDDLVTEKKILPRGPEPLFRDLPAFASLPETQNYNAALTYNNNNNSNDNNGIVMKEPVPVDGLFSFQQQEHHGHEKVDEQKQEHRPIPPVPISMSPLMSPHGEDALEAKDNVEIYQMRSDPSDVLSDEGQYVSRAVLKELNTDTFSRSPTPKEMQQESVSVPFFSGWTNNAAFSRSSNNQPQQQQSSLLRDGDEETRLFDDDDDAELERIKQLVNLVLSIGASENKSVAADVTCDPKSSLDAGMEWLNTRYNSNQPDTSFFHNI